MRAPLGPWSFIRQGLAAGIKRVDNTGTNTPQTQSTITVNFDTDTTPRSVDATLTLVGPGEIAGLGVAGP